MSLPHIPICVCLLILNDKPTLAAPHFAKWIVQGLSFNAFVLRTRASSSNNSPGGVGKTAKLPEIILQYCMSWKTTIYGGFLCHTRKASKSWDCLTYDMDLSWPRRPLTQQFTDLQQRGVDFSPFTSATMTLLLTSTQLDQGRHQSHQCISTQLWPASSRRPDPSNRRLPREARRGGGLGAPSGRAPVNMGEDSQGECGLLRPLACHPAQALAFAEESHLSCSMVGSNDRAGPRPHRARQESSQRSLGKHFGSADLR